MIAFLLLTGAAQAGERVADVRLRLRPVDGAGAPLAVTATLHAPAQAGGPGTPLRADGAGVLESPPLPVPLDAALTLQAVGHASVRLEPVGTGDRDGVLDLGEIVLEPGVDVRLHVVDEAGDSVPDATIYAVPAGAPFPPRPADAPHRFTTVLEPSSRIACTGAGGTARCGLLDGACALAVRAAAFAPAWLAVDPANTADVTVTLTASTKLPLEVRVTAPERLPDGKVTLRVDAGGLVHEVDLPVNAPAAILLDRPRAVVLQGEPRGFHPLVVPLPALAEEPLVLALEPLDLCFTRIIAVDAASGRELPVTDLRVGRARDSRPDRIDFVPDWNALPSMGAGRAVAGAPPGRHDVLVTGARSLQTLHRDVEFAGTAAAPGVVRLPVPPAAPVGGRVVDAATGAPIAGARVVVRRTSRDLDDVPLLWRLAGTVGLIGARVTGADGRFTVPTAAWERVVVEVEAPGYARAALEVARDAAHSVTVALEPGRVVGGRLAAAPAAAPVPAFAYLQDVQARRRLATPVAPDGSFRFVHVPAGDWWLYAGQDDRALFAGREPGLEHALARALHEVPAGMAIPAAGDLADLVLEVPAEPLPEPARVTVRLLPDAAAARLLLLRTDTRVPARRVVAADAVGRDAVALPLAAAGPHLLVAVAADGRPLAAVPLDVRPAAAAVALDVRPGGLSVQAPGAASVVARSPRLALEAARTAGLASHAVVALVPDGDGSFRSPPLCAGPWIVERQDATGAVRAVAWVDVPAGGSIAVSLDG